MLRAKYDAYIKNEIIYVEDTCEPATRSVTNDAEQVVGDVVKRFGNYPIKYKDTEGRWDWLVHHKGEFIGFRPGIEPYEGKSLFSTEGL
jgi:uncharacterized protein YchJ